MNLSRKFEESIKWYEAAGELDFPVPNFSQFEEVAKYIKDFITQSKANFITGFLLLNAKNNANIEPLEIAKIVNENNFSRQVTLEFFGFLYTLYRDCNKNHFRPDLNYLSLNNVLLPYFKKIFESKDRINEAYVNWLLTAFDNGRLDYQANLISLFEVLSKNHDVKWISFLNDNFHYFDEPLIDILIERTISLSNSGEPFDTTSLCHLICPEIAHFKTINTNRKLYFPSIEYCLRDLYELKNNQNHLYEMITKTSIENFELLLIEIFGKIHHSDKDTRCYNFINKHFDIIDLNIEDGKKIIEILRNKTNKFDLSIFFELVKEKDFQLFESNIPGKLSKEVLLSCIEETILKKEQEFNSLSNYNPFISENDFPF